MRVIFFEYLKSSGHSGALLVLLGHLAELAIGRQ